MLYQSAYLKQKNEHALMHRDIKSLKKTLITQGCFQVILEVTFTHHTHTVQLQQTLNNKLKVMAHMVHHIVSELGPNFILNGC